MAGEDSAPLPGRPKAYKPLSEAKKKQIAKRAAKIERSRPSNAAFGVSFGAVLSFALIGWRVYRVLNGIQKAAGQFNAVQTAPGDFGHIDPRAGLEAMDKAVEEMIAQPTTDEARAWLDPNKYPNHKVSGMQPQAARDLVAGFYERGAEKVYILEPTSIGKRSETSEIGVKMPQNPAQRKKCLQWAAKHEGDATPSPDLGQKYLLIMTD